jgi:hypothetical protein
VAQIGVVFFHEADHPVVAEADLLELVLGEVIGLVLSIAVVLIFSSTLRIVLMKDGGWAPHDSLSSYWLFEIKISYY